MHSKLTTSWSLSRRIIVSTLARLFKNVPVPPKLAELEPKSCILILQYRSIVLDSLLYSLARRCGFPAISFVENLTTEQSNALSYSAMAADRLFSELCSNSPDTKLYTLNVFFRRGPVRSAIDFKPSILHSIGLILSRKFLILTIGDFFMPSSMNQPSAQQLRRALKLEFYNNLKLVRGTPFQSLRTQERIVLGGEEFKANLMTLAANQRLSQSEAYFLARKAFYNLAANPNNPIFNFIGWLAGVITRRLFSQINTVGLERFASAAREHTVVLVPSHKSHLDYIVLGRILYESNLNHPLVAAGHNLSFWPAGFFIRSVGGYFVKREAREDRIHALVFKRYVTYLIKRGHLQEFFIEGGRSRSGKFLQPKIGLMRIIIEACLKGVGKDVLFVPVSISYENVIEDQTLASENTGQKKIKENLWSLLRAHSIFDRKYGEVVINFGEPLSAAQFLGADPERKDIRAQVSSFATLLTQKIRSGACISLSSLVYSALMMAPRYGLSRAELVTSVKNLARLVSVLALRDSSIVNFSPALTSFLQGREYLINGITLGGVVKVGSCLSQEVFFIPGKLRYTADFYRNGVVHLFFPVAVQGLVELMVEQSQNDSPPSTIALKFFELFKYDYMLDGDFLSDLNADLSALVKSDILVPCEHGYTFKNRASGLFIPWLLHGAVESYSWVIQNLLCYGIDTVPYHAFIARLQQEFKTAIYLGALTRTEASSKSSLEGCIGSLVASGMILFKENGKRGRLIEISERGKLEEILRLLFRATESLNHRFKA